jgi:hypothetical protein
MIIGLSSTRAHTLSQEFVQGEVKKEYIARCSGEFSTEEVVVEQPLLTVDRQMGLNIVHPQGKVRSITRSALSWCHIGESRSQQRRYSNGCTTTEAQTRACFAVSSIGSHNSCSYHMHRSSLDRSLYVISQSNPCPDTTIFCQLIRFACISNISVVLSPTIPFTQRQKYGHVRVHPRLSTEYQICFCL